MDVVLDSLAREFVDASLRLLPRGGRFVEMGKTDIRDAGQVAADHPGVVYQDFDVMDAGLDRIQEMFQALVVLFAQGVLVPLPLVTWDVRRASEAFRYLSQARHVGKVVLSIPRVLDSVGTVLVTGASVRWVGWWRGIWWPSGVCGPVVGEPPWCRGSGHGGSGRGVGRVWARRCGWRPVMWRIGRRLAG